jgi:hypothetical protein
MPFLAILKRFEVWLLLAIVGALFVFASQPAPPLPGTVAMEPDPAERENHPPQLTSPDLEKPGPPSAPPSLEVREVRVTPSSFFSSGNALLSYTFWASLPAPTTRSPEIIW